MIRRRLVEATGWRYLGEETGRFDPEGTNDDTPIWIVDPNDGTAAYLRGFRGSSTSIGLVHRGVPVLGVVYAYAWPDDRGELVAWAEGEPLQVDGVHVTRDVSSLGHDERTVVAVSQDADLAPDANARCVSPSRYFPLASIAHRLARVATGDVDAAVCLSGIASWDVAAGHALVRAASGIVVDENGREIAYDARGEASARWCFAGAPDIVHAIRKRAWEDVRKERKQLPLVWPERGGGSANAESAQGALLAALALDAANDGELSSEARALIRSLRASLVGDAIPEASVSAPRIIAAIAGAKQGRDAIARELRRAILTRREGAPEEWAVDALTLAEALV